MKKKYIKNIKIIALISLLGGSYAFAATCPLPGQVTRSQNYWISSGGWRSEYPVGDSATQVSFLWAAAAHAVNPPDGKLAGQLVCEYIDANNNPLALLNQNNQMITITVGDWKLIQNGPITHTYSWWCSQSQGQVIPISPMDCQFEYGQNLGFKL